MEETPIYEVFGASALKDKNLSLPLKENSPIQSKGNHGKRQNITGTLIYSEGQTMKIGIRLPFSSGSLVVSLGPVWHHAEQNSRDTQKEEHSFQSFLWLICKEPST